MNREMVAEIDLRENGIYTVRDGKLEPVDKPPYGFGKTIINWQDGKPTHYDAQYTKKLG